MHTSGHRKIYNSTFNIYIYRRLPCLVISYQLPPWETLVPERNEKILLPPTAEHEIEAITALQNLANAVIANAASRTLAKYAFPL